MFPVSSLLKMVNDHGQSLTLTQKSSITYDPVTGDYSSSDTSEVFLGYFYNDLSGLLAQQDIERGARALLIPFKNITLEPAIGDTVTGQRDTVKITTTNFIYSGDNPVCYVLGVNE